MSGLSQAGLQLSYLVDNSRLDLANHKAPSTPMGCDFCAGMVGTYALKILLKRGRLVVAPKALHFDAYRNKLLITWRPWGNNNPLQRFILKKARKTLKFNAFKSMALL